jgi:hypothetical protein
MDDTEFDGIIARASDPHLIPGIYNYCDRRCERCSFTDRCFQFRERRRADRVGRNEGLSIGQVVARSLERSVDMLQIIGRRIGVDLIGEHDDVDALRKRATLAREIDAQDACASEDPLVRRAREYATTSWPILRALRPILEARGEPSLLRALETLESSAASISAKIFRAVLNLEEGDDPVQNDANGSAKIARIMINDANSAWRTLMEPGQATADGVPARLAQLLDELDAALEARFPRAMDFVRPGFDTERPAA